MMLKGTKFDSPEKAVNAICAKYDDHIMNSKRARVGVIKTIEADTEYEKEFLKKMFKISMMMTFQIRYSDTRLDVACKRIHDYLAMANMIRWCAERIKKIDPGLKKYKSLLKHLLTVFTLYVSAYKSVSRGELIEFIVAKHNIAGVTIDMTLLHELGVIWKIDDANL